MGYHGAKQTDGIAVHSHGKTPKEAALRLNYAAHLAGIALPNPGIGMQKFHKKISQKKLKEMKKILENQAKEQKRKNITTQRAQQLQKRKRTRNRKYFKIDEKSESQVVETKITKISIHSQTASTTRKAETIDNKSQLEA